MCVWEDPFFDKPSSDCLSFLEPSCLSNQLEIKNYSIHIDLINLTLSMRRDEFLDPIWQLNSLRFGMHDRYVVNICPVGLKENKKIYWLVSSYPSQAVVSCDPAFWQLCICVIKLGLIIFLEKLTCVISYIYLLESLVNIL